MFIAATLALRSTSNLALISSVDKPNVSIPKSFNNCSLLLRTFSCNLTTPASLYIESLTCAGVLPPSPVAILANSNHSASDMYLLTL